jgi:hypothetical protein
MNAGMHCTSLIPLTAGYLLIPMFEIDRSFRSQAYASYVGDYDYTALHRKLYLDWDVFTNGKYRGANLARSYSTIIPGSKAPPRTR